MRVPLTLPVLLLLPLVGGILLGHGQVWGLVWLVALVLIRSVPVLVLAVLCALWGGCYSHHLHHLPNPLAAHQGQKWVLQGHWDGGALQLQDPAVRVALRPAPALPPGNLTVQGTLGLPETRRNFGAFDHRAWLALRGVHHELQGAKVLHHQPDSGLQAYFANGLTTGLTVQHGALMVALELGDRQDLREQQLGEWSMQEAFTRAGVAHFLALSGQHVAILVGLLHWLLRPLGSRRSPVLLGLLGLYLLLVGIEPSILRAVLQGAAVLLALWLGKGQLDLLGTLALSGVFSLLCFPGWLFDIGFQLSYLAVLGLAFSGEVARRLPDHWPPWLTQGLAASLCAELTTLPVVASNFNSLPWISPLSNLVLAPFMLVLVPGGMLAGLLGPLGGVVNVLLGLVLQVFLWLVQVFAAFPPVPWGTVSPAGFAVYGVWLVACFWCLRNCISLSQLGLLSVVAVLITLLPHQLMRGNSITFLDVGQGDSTLIQLGPFAALIDGGGSPGSTFDVGGKTVVPALRKLGVFQLHVVVATHADTDHIEGLSSVLQQVPTAELWVGEGSGTDPGMQALLEVAHQQRVRVREVRRGDLLQIGRSSLQVLYPEGHSRSQQDNDNSVALRLVSGKLSAVFLGDLPSHIEDHLGLGPTEVLKVAHHGSRHSTSEAFLQQLQPRMAIISSGRNTYGHPHGEVLARLQSQGIQILRTDQRGAVRLYWH